MTVWFIHMFVSVSLDLYLETEEARRLTDPHLLLPQMHLPSPPILPPQSPPHNRPTVPYSPTYTASSPPNSSPVFLRYPLLAPSVISPFLGIFSASIFPINFFTSWTATPDTPISWDSSSLRQNLRQLHCILANNAPDRWHLCIPNKLLSWGTGYLLLISKIHIIQYNIIILITHRGAGNLILKPLFLQKSGVLGAAAGQWETPTTTHLGSNYEAEMQRCLSPSSSSSSSTSSSTSPSPMLSSSQFAYHHHHLDHHPHYPGHHGHYIDDDDHAQVPRHDGPRRRRLASQLPSSCSSCKWCCGGEFLIKFLMWMVMMIMMKIQGNIDDSGDWLVTEFPLAEQACHGGWLKLWVPWWSSIVGETAVLNVALTTLSLGHAAGALTFWL